MNEEDVRITRATAGDFNDVLKLYYEFYSELRSKQGWRPHPIEEYAEDVRRYLRSDAVFIARVGGEAVGFARVSMREGSYWIEEIYVRPEHRGKGIGKALVKAAEEYIVKHDPAAYVMVLPQDTEAITFWVKAGYSTLNTIELVKYLKPIPGIKASRYVEVFGHVLRMLAWAKEGYGEAEAEYLEALKEFAEAGGSREEFLKVVASALKEWVKGKKGT